MLSCESGVGIKVIKIDLENSCVHVSEADGRERKFALNTQEAFALISKAWLRCGWDTKYVYSFSWMGRPVIQLPEDMVRTQEVIYRVKPDLIIETGVAHGGSLIYYASLCKMMNKGRVVGIDIEIRPHNRKAIESHELYGYIKLIEGSSTSEGVLSKVAEEVRPGEKVLVLLDSNHTREHVLQELRSYSKFVSPGSYIVATDGIMGDLVGAPRSSDDWSWNNPKEAAAQFLKEDACFQLEEPEFPFNEGIIKERVTYWPSAWLKRIK